MEHLSMALRALFNKVKGDDILKNAGFLTDEKDTVAEVRHLDTNLQESEITNLLLNVVAQTKYSIDQLSMTGQMVISKWMMRDMNCLPMKFHPKDSVFNVLLHFVSRNLVVKDGDPVCRYPSLLRWHTLTTQLGEDLFTTALLASRNNETNYKRQYFDWKAYIDHDSKEINALLKKPMAELHMHLKGSSYNIDISWICLMNNVEDMMNVFDEVYDKRKDAGWDKDFYAKMRRAAAIRLYLAGVTGNVSKVITRAELHSMLDWRKFDKEVKELSEDIREDVVKRINLQKILNEVHSNNVDEAKSCQIDAKYVLDYIPLKHYKDEPVANLVMASERKLMYDLFQMIYSDKELDPDIPTLFYAYLTYKDQFRHAILQLNERVGFRNFANYEELKTDFILQKYKCLIYKAAIEGFVDNDKSRYIEARIVPKDSVDGIKKSLNEIYSSLHDDVKDNCSIIFHFIKKRDESFTKEKSIRNNELRENVKKQAFAICNFRRGEDEDNLVGHVVGVDAANSEIYARPEVFAQAFRFLRGHELFQTEYQRPNDLNITYHVGEDFLDIADGLRAVEEALIFLGLRNGDRLGHALVLGTGVREYYKKRYDTICESKQVLLDNMAWLHHKCISLMGYRPICGYFEMKFHQYFRELYNKNTSQNPDFIEEIFSPWDDGMDDLDNIETYYLSWMLRGNSPTFGEDLDPENINKVTDETEKQWRKAAICHHPGVDMACRNANARELFDRYHSREIAEKSNLVDSFTIRPRFRDDYYTLLELIQEDLMKRIEKRHIAIECNPSSNYKIGEMERYDQHPIVRFFNFGLDTPYKPHNISVSINTDDQGVFSTSLEREYSLMALAMEKNEIQGHYNSPRAIIEWLDRVREMSLVQRFDYKKNKLKQ